MNARRPRTDLALATSRMALAPIALATLTLGIGFARAGRPVWVWIGVLVGMGWLAVSWFRWQEAWSNLGFTALALLAMAGALAGAPGALTLTALVAALTGWDLAHLARRLSREAQPAEALRLRQLHLRRLALSDLLGLALGALALYARLSIGLAPLLLIGLAAIAALSAIAGWPRRQG
jgi:hypothetical protein